jgi:outer membrane autotransporter protein
VNIYNVSVTRDSSTFGSLGGEGTVGNVINNGIVFPGHSINELHVNDYTQEAEGWLQVEIAPAPEGSTEGESDKILASGTATLDGYLEVKLLEDVDIGFYKKGTKYQVIIAEGGITGNFSDIIENTPFNFSTEIVPTLPLSNAPEVSQTLFLIILEDDYLLLPIDQIKGDNPRNIAKYITNCFILDGSDFERVAEAIGQLNLGQLNDALNQMSAGRFGALTWIDFRNDRTISRLFGDHLTKLYRCDTGIADCSGEENTFCLEKKKWSVWFEPFFYYSDQNRAERQLAYDARSFGGVIGADYTFPSHFCLGGGLGYSYSDMDWEKDLGDSHINGVYGGLYGSYYNKWGFINLSILGTRSFYHVDRRVRFPGIDRTGTHNHKSWDLTTHLGVGLDLLAASTFHIQPSVDLDYINIWEGSFQESNAGSISLEVDSKHSAFFRSLVAMNFLKDFRLRTSCWTPGIIAGWIHESPLTSKNRRAKMTQITCPGTFKSATYHDDRNLALIGASLTGIQQSGFVFYLNYFFEFKGSFHQHNASARFEWNF